VNKLNAQSCYELIWSDEFNYSGLPDSTVWYFEEGGNGWGNNELQYYTSKRIENAHVENGNLTIEARKENYNGRQYTSARLITYPTNHTWKYGKIEAKIKLPYGQGIWPAFWALGNGIFENTPWPACGEIDIVELVGGGEGRDDKIYGTMHYDDNGHAEYGGSYQLPTGIFADAFHIFSIEWTSSQIKWFIDGIQFHSATITAIELSEFQKNFFLLLNVAVGGNWPGSPDATTVFPQKMIVDYVRVYQLNSQPEIIGDTLIYKAQKDIIYKTVESENFTYNWNVPSGANITEGQGTNTIHVTWGCDTGSVACQMTTLCNTYDLTLSVKTKSIKISGTEKVEEFSDNNKYFLPALNETTYYWEVPNGVSIVGQMDTNIVFLNWGNNEGYVKVSASNICGIEYDSIFVTIARQLPYPNSGVKQPIPGTIEATNYDSGGEGFSYHDNDSENKGTGPRQDEAVDTEYNDGGSSIGWIQPGEWVEYTVNVESSGLYDIELRVASLNGGGQMEILFSDEVRTGLIPIQATGSWVAFTSAFVRNIALFDTDTLMRLHFIVGEFNISRLIFSKNATFLQNISSDLSKILLYPNPANNTLNLLNINETFNYTIINITGEISQKGLLLPETNINIKALHKGTYFLNLYNNKHTFTFRFIKL